MGGLFLGQLAVIVVGVLHGGLLIGAIAIGVRHGVFGSDHQRRLLEAVDGQGGWTDRNTCHTNPLGNRNDTSTSLTATVLRNCINSCASFRFGGNDPAAFVYKSHTVIAALPKDVFIGSI